MKVISQQSGLTLLESLLVLGIVTTLLLFSLQQYQALKRDSEIETVKTNVDILFGAMEKYFRAHCNDPKNALSSYYDKQYLPIEMKTLTDEKYLILPNGSLAFSPIVSDYLLQFNQVQNATAPLLPQRLDENGFSLGSIVIWRIQVSAQLADKTQQKTFASLLGADCLSGIMNNNVVNPCTSSSTNSDYAVWERLPGLSSSYANSPSWEMLPMTQQFKQMYQTYPMYTAKPAPDPVTGTPQEQYYTCNGI